jgi:hypothetical protein
MSVFSVLGVAALTTRFGEQPAGSSFIVMHGFQGRSAMTEFVGLPVIVPESWRVPGANGPHAFQLGVLVPDNGNDETGASGALHSMSENEVPGMAVCCESLVGACSHRKAADGVSEIAEWTPGSDDAQWLSLRLGSQPDSDGKTDLITATVLAAAEASPSATPIVCQLEREGAIIAKGIAHLRQLPRQDGLNLLTDTVDGTFDIAVRTK